jgi:hypothetical protein
MKTFTILLLLIVHLVAFSQISPKQTSQSLKNPQNPEFFKTNLKHMGSYVVSDKKIPDLRAPQNSKLNRLKTDALEKIKQKEKSQNERLLNIRSRLSGSLNQEVYLLDSLHVYSYSSPADSILFGKIFLVYDEAGNNISFYTSELDTLTNQWQFSYKEDYYPDDLGRDTLQIFYYWNMEMNDWMPESKEENRFDDSGNTIRMALYYWEMSEQKWIGEFKTESMYDEFGNQTFFAFYTWDFTLSQWIGLVKNESEFDQQGNQISSADYYWDQNLNNWRGDYKYVIEILDDENGYYQSFTTYGWDEPNSQWKEYSKNEFAYSTLGKILFEAFYDWDEFSESWKGDYKSEFFYADNSQDFDIIYYSWSETINDWIQSEKSEILFDEFGNNLTTRNYVWDESVNEWTLFSKVDNIFNELNLLEESVESSLKDTIGAAQLIKGFDSDEEILNIIGDNSCEGKSCLTVDDENIEGAGAVNWSYDILDFEEWGGYSQIQLSNSVNMEGDDGIVLFYKNVIPSDARFFLIFLESSGEEWRFEDNFMLADTASGWQQFVVPFENFFIPYFRAPVNGIFELDDIESIRIELFVPSGVTAMGSVSLDNFSTFKYEKTEDWITSARRQLAYDMQGNLVSDTIYQWDNDLKVLAPNYYALKNYDQNNYQTGHESYNWEYNFMGWVGDWKYELIVNEQGFVTSSVFYNWDYDSGDWVGSQKNESSFNEQGLETGFASYFWDNNLGIWIGESKEESTFNQFGNRTSQEISGWDYAENDWSLNYKIEWNYDGNQELASEKYFEWDATSGDWIITDTYYYTKWEEFFNERGDVELAISAQWNENLMEWAPVNKYFYFYSELTTKSHFPELQPEQFAEIYPNPARNFVNVRFNSDVKGTVSLLDFNGRTIKTEILSGSLKSVPLHDFPPGMYIVQIKTDRNVFSQKLVVQ